ncbi:MAG: DUF4174 domain-containing protein [Bacteroidota bacterium]
MISNLSIWLTLTLTSSNPLESHLWKQRVVIVFSRNTQTLNDQLSHFYEAKDEFTDRDLVIYSLNIKQGTYPDQKSMSQEDYQWFVQNYIQDKDDFLVVLIGKDGGTKFKSNITVANSKLFDLIDSMPMRIQEMKGQ